MAMCLCLLDSMPVEVSNNLLKVNYKIFPNKGHFNYNHVTAYPSTGGVTIPDGMIFTVDSDLNGDSLQYTLTCISTGGPATTVTWTRDSETVSGGMTVLDNAMTAHYTHTLTVTGRLGGQYQCNVTNNKPSTVTAQFIVQGKL